MPKINSRLSNIEYETLKGERGESKVESVTHIMANQIDEVKNDILDLDQSIKSIKIQERENRTLTTNSLQEMDSRINCCLMDIRNIHSEKINKSDFDELKSQMYGEHTKFSNLILNLEQKAATQSRIIATLSNQEISLFKNLICKIKGGHEYGEAIYTDSFVKISKCTRCGKIEITNI